VCQIFAALFYGGVTIFHFSHEGNGWTGWTGWAGEMGIWVAFKRHFPSQHVLCYQGAAAGTELSFKKIENLYLSAVHTRG